MAKHNWLQFFGVMVVALAATASDSGRASAAFVLNARYSGSVFGIDDPYGVFGSIAEGDAVSGVIRYSSTKALDYADSNFTYVSFPTTPDGKTLMTATIGSYQFKSTGDVTVQTYNYPSPDDLYGYDFQFNNSGAGPLTASGLPTGYQIGHYGVLVGLFSPTPAPIHFPNPPSSLLGLSSYDSPYTGAFVYADFFNAKGNYVGTSSFGIQLTSVTNVVPAPSSALLALLGLPAVWPVLRRRGLK